MRNSSECESQVIENCGLRVDDVQTRKEQTPVWLMDEGKKLPVMRLSKGSSPKTTLVDRLTTEENQYISKCLRHLVRGDWQFHLLYANFTILSTSMPAVSIDVPSLTIFSHDFRHLFLILHKRSRMFCLAGLLPILLHPRKIGNK